MRASDHIIDLGPGAGEHGGNVVAYGCVEEIQKSEQSITGQDLRGNRVIPVSAEAVVLKNAARRSKIDMVWSVRY